VAIVSVLATVATVELVEVEVIDETTVLVWVLVVPVVGWKTAVNVCEPSTVYWKFMESP
jgi:hypothetical protein